jgi:peptidoglycan/LPS O-acetylase OafA/YrhL
MAVVLYHATNVIKLKKPLLGSRTWVWGIMFKTLYRAFLSINLGCVVFNLANRLADWLGELSFSLYLAHPSWSKILLYLPGVSGWKFAWQLLAYVAVSLLSGLVIMYLSRLVCAFWRKHGQKIRSAFIVETD